MARVLFEIYPQFFRSSKTKSGGRISCNFAGPRKAVYDNLLQTQSERRHLHVAQEKEVNVVAVVGSDREEECPMSRQFPSSSPFECCDRGEVALSLVFQSELRDCASRLSVLSFRFQKRFH